MFTTIVSKPIFINTLFSVALGACIAMGTALFLPSQGVHVKPHAKAQKQSHFAVAKAFHLIEKREKVVKKVLKTQRSHEYLLKDFSITGIFLDGNESVVIVRAPKGGIFLQINKSYKGYKLVNVYMKKARFQKGVDYYWSFLDPLDEKKFHATPQKQTTQNTKEATAFKVRESVAVDMFEDIKYKNGVYFIPRSMLSDAAAINRHLASIGAVIYNINGSMSFKVTYVAPHSIFRKLGLRRGDFIVALNGKPFHSIQEPLAFYKNITNLENLRVTIKRGNKTKELKYEVY